MYLSGGTRINGLGVGSRPHWTSLTWLIGTWERVSHANHSAGRGMPGKLLPKSKCRESKEMVW